MSIIKPSTAFKAGANWLSSDVRAYMGDQVPIFVDAIADVQGNDFESAWWVYVKAKGAFYRLNLASGAADNGDTVLQDSTGKRYEKQSTFGGRETLTVNRSYYVRTDGSDSNNGLANSSGGAFLTIAKAVAAALALDFMGYTATINVGAGSFAGFTISSPPVGGSLTVVGAGAGSTTITSTINVSGGGSAVTLGSMKIVPTTGNSLTISNGGRVSFTTGMEFGAAVGADHIRCLDSAFIAQGVAYTISGGAANHLNVSPCSFANIFGATITLTGTPVFSGAFVSAVSASVVSAGGASFIGSATGVRYSATLNGVINTGGGGASFLPGGTAGSTATGGQYA